MIKIFFNIKDSKFDLFFTQAASVCEVELPALSEDGGVEIEVNIFY